MVIPTSPRLSKTESGYKSYCGFYRRTFSRQNKEKKQKKEKRREPAGHQPGMAGSMAGLSRVGPRPSWPAPWLASPATPPAITQSGRLHDWALSGWAPAIMAGSMAGQPGHSPGHHPAWPAPLGWLVAIRCFASNGSFWSYYLRGFFPKGFLGFLATILSKFLPHHC